VAYTPWLKEVTEKHILATAGTKTLTHSKTVIAALKRCATQNRSFYASSESHALPGLINAP
jgi:hypothetical protein